MSAGLGAVLASCGRGVTGSAEASPTLEQSRPLSEHPPLSRSLRIPPAPSLTRQIAEKHDQNADTVGWLQVPGTGIDDVVVHHPHDQNEFYLRRNFDRRTSMAGAYFADFRNTFNGRAGGLSRNTVIYGHSLSLDDDPDAPYFDQLKRFLDEDFARANPYIFFSLAEEDLVWQIFAVYYATVALPYNHPDFDDGAFADIVLEMQKRSEFIYDVEVGPDDKILTLSTCTYVFTPGVHPNRYRFVVSARLMREGETRGEAAGLTRNPAPKDP
ncbi:MAG: class B sortase [Oscillospiraceae bacterium]|nr:class B sortase [Oscillospiraceae bacterium]